MQTTTLAPPSTAGKEDAHPFALLSMALYMGFMHISHFLEVAFIYHFTLSQWMIFYLIGFTLSFTSLTWTLLGGGNNASSGASQQRSKHLWKHISYHPELMYQVVNVAITIIQTSLAVVYYFHYGGDTPLENTLEFSRLYSFHMSAMSLGFFLDLLLGSFFAVGGGGL